MSKVCLGEIYIYIQGPKARIWVDVHDNHLNESAWMINRQNLRIRSRHKYNNLYPLMVINPEGVVNVTKKTNPNLWHGRLGHMSQAGLDRLMAVSYISKLQTKRDFCEHCRYGKQTQSSHSLHYETVHHPLELVHTDICGYFITFVDDCTCLSPGRKRPSWHPM